MPFGSRGRRAKVGRPNLRTDYGPFDLADGDAPLADIDRFVRHALLLGDELMQRSDAVLAEHLGAVASAPMHFATDLCDTAGFTAVVRALHFQGTAQARAILHAMAAANDGGLEALAGAAAQSIRSAVADPPWMRDLVAPIELRHVIGLVGREDPAEQAVLYVFRRARRAHGFLVEIERGMEVPREISWTSNRDASPWLRQLQKGTWKNGIAYRISFEDVGRGVGLLEGMMNNTVVAQLREMDDWPNAAVLPRPDAMPTLPSLLVLMRKSVRSALALDAWPYMKETPWAPWRQVGSARSRPAAHSADGLVRTVVATENGLERVRALAGSSPALRDAVDELFGAEAEALAGTDGKARADAALSVVRFETFERGELEPVLAWALASSGQTALVGSSFVEAASRFTEAHGMAASVVEEDELRSGIGVAVSGMRMRLGGMLSQASAAEVLAGMSDAEVEQAPGLMDRLRTIGKGYVDARQWEPATLCLESAGLLGFITGAVSPFHRLAYVEVIGAVADSKARQGEHLMGLRATSDGLGEAIEALTSEPSYQSVEVLRAALGMDALMPLILSAPRRLPIVEDCEGLRGRADRTAHESGPSFDEAVHRLLQDARALKATFDQIIENNERH